MAQLNVNPTRMELARLKKSLAAATRGHKLLKDKRDELMRQLLELAAETKRLRKSVEEKIKRANQYMAVACSVMSAEALFSALLLPGQSAELKIGTKNAVGTDIPTFEIKIKKASGSGSYSYGFVNTSGELDAAISLLSETLEEMPLLAQYEKAAELLAAEAEKTRRRVNALEYVMIPNYRDTIKYISMKLDEAERSSNTRLLKIKDMMTEQRILKNTD